LRKAIAGAVADQVLANRLLSEPLRGRSDANRSRSALSVAQQD
jgi:hypothetical protein